MTESVDTVVANIQPVQIVALLFSFLNKKQAIGYNYIYITLLLHAADAPYDAYGIHLSEIPAESAGGFAWSDVNRSSNSVSQTAVT